MCVVNVARSHFNVDRVATSTTITSTRSVCGMGYCRFSDFTYKIKSRRASWVHEDEKPEELLRSLDQTLRDVEDNRQTLRSLGSDSKAYEKLCRTTSFRCMEKIEMMLQRTRKDSQDSKNKMRSSTTSVATAASKHF